MPNEPMTKKRWPLWLKVGLLFFVWHLAWQGYYLVNDPFLFGFGDEDGGYLMEEINSLIAGLIFYFVLGAFVGFVIREVWKASRFLWLKLGGIFVLAGFLNDIWQTIAEVGLDRVGVRLTKYYGDAKSLLFVVAVYIFYFAVGVVINFAAKILRTQPSLSKGEISGEAKRSWSIWLKYGTVFGGVAFVLSVPMIYFMSQWGPFTDYHPILTPITLSLILAGPIPELVFALFLENTSLVILAFPIAAMLTVMYFLIGSLVGFAVQSPWPSNRKLKTVFLVFVVILIAWGVRASVAINFREIFEKSREVEGQSVRTSHLSQQETVEFINIIVSKGLERERILGMEKRSEAEISFDYAETESAECMPRKTIGRYDEQWYCTYELKKTAQGWEIIDPNDFFF